jgi:glycosyltransferase involved in cell wall biosynthesis
MSEPLRALWLVNDRAALRSDASMLRASGFAGVQVPGAVPGTLQFRGTSVACESGPALDLPAAEREILARTDWYRPLSGEVWELVNRRFAVLGFRPYGGDLLRQILRRFDGMIVLRGLGLSGGESYGSRIERLTRGRGLAMVESLGSRFAFAVAHRELSDLEPEPLRNRAVYLPVELPPVTRAGDGIPEDRPILLFPCPDLNASPHRRSQYEEFLGHFGQVPHLVLGPQAIAVQDARVLGRSPEGLQADLRRGRVLIHDGRDPAAVESDPLEAMRAGVPVVFLGGGLLDRISGGSLPGRVGNWAEAVPLVGRLLRGDRAESARIRDAQSGFVRRFAPEAVREAWRRSGGLLGGLRSPPRIARAGEARRVRKVAVFLPEKYLGGTVRATRAIAESIARGARAAGTRVRVVLAPLDIPGYYPTGCWEGLDSDVELRPACWRSLPAGTAAVASRLAGLAPAGTETIVPEDGHANYLDCDAWVVVSDRVTAPILNVRPVAMFVFDCIRRYLAGEADPLGSILAKRFADRLIVTSEATRLDLVQFASIPSEDIRTVPPVLPESCTLRPADPAQPRGGHFLWGTNMGPHKNHRVAVEALARYYGQLDGRLRCVVTGVDSHRIGEPGSPAAAEWAKAMNDVPAFRRRVRLKGYLGERVLDRVLSRAAFFWNPAIVDNGTFTAVEAACRGVFTVSSDYPAMRELAGRLGMDPIWTPSWDSNAVAEALKAGEEAVLRRRGPEIDAARLALHRPEGIAGRYWEVVEEML